jgi:hypothetical protein
MSWQAFACQKGEVEALGGRTRGERAPLFLIFHFLLVFSRRGAQLP